MTNPPPVFISYGHDRYSPFAEDLNNRLAQADFAPWFDTQIRTGHLLDAQIEQGIRDVSAAGGAAVLLMTKHAVRRGSGTDYGYCLNELALILDLGMDLVPIMVEPCERPGSIQALTYLDLTAQSEVLITPTPEGEQARAVAAERITTALREGPVSLRIDDPDLLLRGKLRPRTFRPPPNLPPNPVPRTWITDKVDDWLRRDSRGLLITGTTGTGKSAFLRMLDDYRGGLTSLHYFKADDSQTLDLGHVVNTMAFKLAGTVPGYRSTLISLLQGPDGAELLALEPLARFRRLVVEPIADLPEPAQPVVIAFDALDEAGNRLQNKALELLEVVADSAHLLPGWFRLLATGRPEAEVISALRGWERVDLDSYATTLVAQDCRELASMYLPEESPERREELVTLAEANLLVLNLYLEEVQADRRDPDHVPHDAHDDAVQDAEADGADAHADADDAQEADASQVAGDVDSKQAHAGAPHGAPAHDSPLDLRYTRTVRRRLGTPALNGFQRDVLACALAARRPLPLDIIAAATGRTRNDVEQFARALGSLVLMQGPAADRHLRLFHGSLGEWLADPDRSDAAHVDAGDGHGLLADLAWARYLDGTLVGSAYLGTRLEVHLAASGQRERLAQATTDADYIAARLRAARDDGHGVSRTDGAEALGIESGAVPAADVASELDTAALWRISSRCQAAGDHWGARYALAAAVQTSRHLADADRPGLAGVEGYLTLAESLSRMAALSLASGRFTDALEEYDEACHILAGLAHEPERDNAAARLDVAQAHQDVGQAALLCGQPDRAAASFCASVVERAAVAQQAASASADERDDADDDGDASLAPITDGAVLLRGKHGRLRFQTPVATLFTAAAAPEDPEVALSVDDGQVLPDTTERGVHATVVAALHSAAIRMAQESGGDDWSSRVDAEDRLWHALLAGDQDLVGRELDSLDVDDERLAVLIARAVAAGRECGQPALAAIVALSAAERRATPELAELLGNVAGDVGEPILTPGERRPVAHAAEAVARQLCADHPDNPNYHDRLANVLLNLGNLESQVGATVPARTAYTEAQARYRQLCADHPNNPNYHNSLANVLLNLGNLEQKVGATVPARTAHTEAHTLCRRLCADHPDNSTYHNHLANVLLNLGNLEQEVGATVPARTAYTEAQARYRQLCADHPNNPTYHDNLAGVLLNLGNLERQVGATVPARTAYTEAQARYRQLCADHPNKPNYHNSLANALNGLGNLELQVGATGPARTAYTEARTLCRQLCADHPDNPNYHNSLANALYRLGIVESLVGATAPARTGYTEAQALFRRLCADHPDNPTYHDRLAAALTTLGMLEFEVGATTPARTAYTEAHTLYRRLCADHPDNPHYHDRLAAALLNLGNLELQVGATVLARTGYTEAHTLYRRLCADHPDNPHYRHRLAVVLLNLGNLETHVGATVLARTAYTEAQARYRRLCADHPNNPDYHDNLAGVLFGLGNVAEAESGPRSPSAARAWREAVLVFDDLDRRGQLRPARRGFAAHARAKSGAGQSPPPPLAATPTWLPVGAPAPTPLAITRAVTTWLDFAPWLDGETWVDSYTHLAAHRSLFTTPEAHAELIAQADEDDLPSHLAILELFTAGMPADELERLTTKPQVALNLIVQTLADHQAGLAARVLAACPALSEIPQGRALDLAITLVDRNPAQAQHAAAQLADTPDAGQIAAEFDRIAAALAIVFDPSDVDTIRDLLRAG